MGRTLPRGRLYDGALGPDEVQMQAGSEDTPPYGSVLDAMRDGWRVFQASAMPERSAGEGIGQLANEYWLERMVETDEPG